MEKLKVWLISVYTQPDINTFLYHGILSCLTQCSHPFELDTSVHPTFYLAFIYQITVGWESLLH